MQNKKSKQRKTKQKSKVLAERDSTSAHFADGEVRRSAIFFSEYFAFLFHQVPGPWIRADLHRTSPRSQNAFPDQR